MNQFPPCPKCHSEYSYPSGAVFVCSQCSFEWLQHTQEKSTEHAALVKDAHGTELHDGDTISLIKDLKIKGSSQVIKVGTKVKNIRILPNEDHNIDCKIEGIGSMKLKAEFVKKA